MINSRAKGARGEREFIQRHLAELWPEACRNLDQYGTDKRDVLRIAGCHWQIKYTERLALWAAIQQAEQEASPTDTPIIAFRRNRSRWYCVLEASELIPLIWAAADHPGAAVSTPSGGYLDRDHFDRLNDARAEQNAESGEPVDLQTYMRRHRGGMDAP